jgi:predicted DNA-binding transcriptional regulator AlpA
VTPPKPPNTLTAAEAAQYIGFSVWWLKNARRTGRGPAYIRCDRAIRYRTADLDAWLEQHVVRTRESA